MTRYAFRPRPFAAETVLDLKEREIVATRAGRDAVFPLREVATIRLFYTPRGINFSGYRAKIYSRSGKTVSFEDRSHKSLIEQERLEGSYRDFVRDLCARAEKANPDVLLHAGRAVTMLALIGAVAAATTLLMGYFLWRSLGAGSYGLALAIAVFTGYFALWSWAYVTRNRPQTFRSSAIPPDVLPGDDAKDH